MATILNMNRRVLYWVCQLLGFSLYMIVGLISFFNDDNPDESGTGVVSLAFLFLATLYLMLSTHVFRYFIHRRRWIKLYLAKLLPRVMGAILVLTLSYFIVTSLMTITAFVITMPNTEQVTEDGTEEVAPDDTAEEGSFIMDVIYGQILEPFNVLSTLVTAFIIYFIWSIIYFMFHYVESYNQTLKYEATINEIELNKLKSQLNPHFIFNALNSIRALVDEDPRKSKIAITQLSTILRNSLIMDKKRLIPFTEEMVTVKDYLALETIRFEERLRTSFHLHPESYRFEVPPLMVQTLVENGIKHGISNLAAGGDLKVETELVKGGYALAIRIRNSGQYVNGVQRRGSGYGIENTKQRLRLIFGQEASFSIGNESEGVVLTEVIIPQKT